MKARIGVAESAKVIEIDVDDAAGFKGEVEAALAGSDSMVWFTDVKKRTVGVPVGRIAYVEIEAEDRARSIGFAPSD